MSGSGEHDGNGIRRRLIELRDELDRMLASSAGSAAPVDLDSPIGRVSRVDALQQQSMAAANRRAVQVRRARVEAALERLEEGDYGACVDCGEEIEPRRLEAQLEAATCLTCQNARERRR